MKVTDDARTMIRRNELFIAPSQGQFNSWPYSQLTASLKLRVSPRPRLSKFLLKRSDLLPRREAGCYDSGLACCRAPFLKRSRGRGRPVSNARKCGQNRHAASE